jgi:hypothetical protein
MNFKKTFCPSPWFHMRINNAGYYEYCRWMSKDITDRAGPHSIYTESPLHFFQRTMSDLRTEFLDGGSPSGCRGCYVMEQHGKVSGRQKQLLKAGVMLPYFDKSLISSPMNKDFHYSDVYNGHTRRTISDWQIDLGNYCNSACVFCYPESSSRLASEWKKLDMLSQVPPSPWCDDPELLNSFINDIVSSPDIKYLHFIGGETLITPAFQEILEALVKHNLANKITIGFTTNLTVWSDTIVELLKQFEQVNLGMSVETLTEINDYVRWPSQQTKTQKILDSWVELGKQQNWLLQIRTTPTCLTVHDLTTVYDYAWKHNISIESCNFLERPAFMRLGVLPKDVRDTIQSKLAGWLQDHPVDDNEQIINTRDSTVSHAQIYQDLESYVNYFDTIEDETFRLPDLVNYLRKLESQRSNSIINYLPQYEQIFRSAGY